MTDIKYYTGFSWCNSALLDGRVPLLAYYYALLAEAESQAGTGWIVGRKHIVAAEI